MVISVFCDFVLQNDNLGILSCYFSKDVLCSIFQRKNLNITGTRTRSRWGANAIPRAKVFDPPPPQAPQVTTPGALSQH